MSWLERSRSRLGQQVDRDVALLRLGAVEGMAHQAVEVEGRGGAGMGLHRAHLAAASSTMRATACATASVASTDEPSGRSIVTDSSDLLSKGSSLTVTSLV